MSIRHVITLARHASGCFNQVVQLYSCRPVECRTRGESEELEVAFHPVRTSRTCEMTSFRLLETKRSNDLEAQDVHELVFDWTNSAFCHNA